MILPFTNGISVRISPGLRSLVSPHLFFPLLYCSLFLSTWMLSETLRAPVMPCLLKIPPFFPAASCELHGLYLTYLLHLPSPPPPYVLHTYLWHPHTSLYFYLLFYFVPVRQWWKITFQQQILPLSLSTILQLVPQMWHICTVYAHLTTAE